MKHAPSPHSTTQEASVNFCNDDSQSPRETTRDRASWSLNPRIPAHKKRAILNEFDSETDYVRLRRIPLESQANSLILSCTVHYIAPRIMKCAPNGSTVFRV